MNDVIEAPETYSAVRDRLDDGNHLFGCGRCGHLAGDPRMVNFRARCPGCELLTKFYRIIE